MDMKLLVLAIAPSIALVMYIYNKDKIEKEPIPLLFIVFVFGALSVIPILIVEGLLEKFNFFTGIAAAFYTSFVVAGFTEEFFKRLVVLKTVFFNKNYNEKLDGIIYCVMASLGFATVENIMYVAVSFKDVPYIGITRAMLSVPAHMLFGVAMGYYLSLSKYAITERQIQANKTKSLLIPIILHGTFNFILMSGSSLLMLFFIPYIIYLWKFNLKKMKEYKEDSIKNHRHPIDINDQDTEFEEE